MREATVTSLEQASNSAFSCIQPETPKTLKMGEISIFSGGGLRPFGLPGHILRERWAHDQQASCGARQGKRAALQRLSVWASAHAPAPLRGLGAAAGIPPAGPVAPR